MIRLLLLLAPFAALAGLIYWGLLRRYDINYYLSHRPPVFWAALSLAALDLLALVAVIMRYLARWLLGLPLVAIEHCAPGQALAESSRRMQGHRSVAATLLAAWALMGLALSLLSLPLLQALGRTVAPAFGETLRGILVFSGLVALLGLAASFALSVLLKALLALITARFYLATASIAELQLHARRLAEPGPAESAMRRRWPIIVGAVIALALAGAALGYALLQGTMADRPVLVFAHRGASAAAPENTLAAFRRAGLDHADFVELDVQETADGVVVVAHDSDLMKVGALAIEDLGLDRRTTARGRYRQPLCAGLLRRARADARRGPGRVPRHHAGRHRTQGLRARPEARAARAWSWSRPPACRTRS